MKPSTSLEMLGLKQGSIDQLIASNRDMITMKRRPYEYEKQIVTERNRDYVDVMRAELEELSRNSTVGLQERMGHISGVKELNGHMKRERNMRRQE